MTSVESNPTRARRVRAAEGEADGGRRASSEALLRRYQRRPSHALRDELVERHREDVEAMARALAARLPRSVDVQDLVHAGFWGLIQAIDAFRPERGAAFRAFMRPRVRGAMLDELRNMDFLPRLYRRRLRAREDAAGRLRSQLLREPSDAELAAELGISEARLHRSYTPVGPVGRPGDRIAADRGVTDGARGRPDRSRLDPEHWLESLADEALEDPFDAAERHDLIRAIEESLQPIEWTVLRLHYLEGMSGKEVAAHLRLSAARICQIHVRVLERLKSRLRAARR